MLDTGVDQLRFPWNPGSVLGLWLFPHTGGSCSKPGLLRVFAPYNRIVAIGEDVATEALPTPRDGLFLEVEKKKALTSAMVDR